MEKWIKRLIGLTAVIGAVAGLVYYLKNRCSCDGEDELVDDFEDEDFDLDNDLKPVSDREYVPLTPSKPDAETEASDNEPAKDNAEETKDTAAKSKDLEEK